MRSAAARIAGRAVAIAALLLALLFTLAAQAQAPAQPQAPVRYGEGLFFKLDKPGTPPSWVYGTIHIGAPCEAYPKQKVIDRVRTSRLLMKELVLDQASTVRLRAAAALPETQNLSDFVRRADFERLAAIYGEAGVPRSRLERLQIWAATNGLIQLVRPNSRAVDAEIADFARRAGRTSVALETVDEQLAFFTNFPLEEQLAMLRYGIDHFARLPQLIDRLLAAWRAEDGATLRRMSDGRDPDVPAGPPAYQAAIRRRLEASAERDRRMVERALPELERGGVVVAVGALHLPGDTAMLSLLAGRGFTVTRDEGGPLELPTQCSQVQQPGRPSVPAAR